MAPACHKFSSRVHSLTTCYHCIWSKMVVSVDHTAFFYNYWSVRIALAPIYQSRTRKCHQSCSSLRWLWVLLSGSHALSMFGNDQSHINNSCNRWNVQAVMRSIPNWFRSIVKCVESIAVIGYQYQCLGYNYSKNERWQAAKVAQLTSSGDAGTANVKALPSSRTPQHRSHILRTRTVNSHHWL